MHRACFSALLVLLSGLMGMLTGCGSTVVPRAPIPPGSPTTGATAALSITTDRTNYAPTDVIRGMVTNQSGATIYATAGHASCTILTLEVMTNGRWQPTNAAACPSQPAQAFVQIANNATYRQFIRAVQFPARPGAFSAGEYRLSLLYWQTIQGSIPSVNSGLALSSPPFTIG